MLDPSMYPMDKVNVPLKRFLRWLQTKSRNNLVTREEVREAMAEAFADRVMTNNPQQSRWAMELSDMLEDHIGTIRAGQVYKWIRAIYKGEDEQYNGESLRLWRDK